MPGRFRSAYRALCAAVVYAFPVAVVADSVTPDRVSFSDFSDVSSVTLNGDAAAIQVGEDHVLRLTPAEAGTWGSAFLAEPLTFPSDLSFSTHFALRISDPGPKVGADGLAFVVHTDPRGPTAMGEGGGNIGYFDFVNGETQIQPSVAVEFDTFKLAGVVPDPSSNHVGIDVNGDVTSVASAEAPQPLDNGNVKYCWVDYDGAADLMEVYFSERDLKPTTPILTHTLDLGAIFGDQRELYAGFTAGAGGEYENHDVLNWTFGDEPEGLKISGRVEYRDLNDAWAPGESLMVDLYEDGGTTPLATSVTGMGRGDPNDAGAFILSAGQAAAGSTFFIKVRAENAVVRVLAATQLAGGLYDIGPVYEYDFHDTALRNVADDVSKLRIQIRQTPTTPDDADAFGVPGYYARLREWCLEVFGFAAQERADVWYRVNDAHPSANGDVIKLLRLSMATHDATHEYAHFMHHEVNQDLLGKLPGWDWPTLHPLCKQHSDWSETNVGFALSEGWAEALKDLYSGGTLGFESGLPQYEPFWMGDDGSCSAQLVVDDTNVNGNTGDVVEGAVGSIIVDLCDGDGGADDDGINPGLTRDFWRVMMDYDIESIWKEHPADPPTDLYHGLEDHLGTSNYRALDEIFIDHGVPATDDALETFDSLDNDRRASAHGLGVLGDAITHANLIAVDQDWYSFEVPEPGATVRLEADFDEQKGKLRLIWGQDGGDGQSFDFLGEGEPALNAKLATGGSVSEGTYYVLVTGAGDDVGPDSNYETGATYEGDYSPNYALAIMRDELAADEPPVITRLDPNWVWVGEPIPLDVIGRNFTSDSRARVGGVLRTTQIHSASLLTATLLDDDVATPGSVGIRVDNFDENGWISNIATLIVRPKGPPDSNDPVDPNDPNDGDSPDPNHPVDPNDPNDGGHPDPNYPGGGCGAGSPCAGVPIIMLTALFRLTRRPRRR